MTWRLLLRLLPTATWCNTQAFNQPLSGLGIRVWNKSKFVRFPLLSRRKRGSRRRYETVHVCPLTRQRCSTLKGKTFSERKLPKMSVCHRRWLGMFQTTEQMKKRARNLKKNFLNVYYEIMEHASALSEEIILELFRWSQARKKNYKAKRRF